MQLSFFHNLSLIAYNLLNENFYFLENTKNLKIVWDSCAEPIFLRERYVLSAKLMTFTSFFWLCYFLHGVSILITIKEELLKSI